MKLHACTWHDIYVIYMYMSVGNLEYNLIHLTGQLEEVITANKGLEEQLLAVQREKHDSVEGTLINEIKETYDREVYMYIISTVHVLYIQIT